MHFHVFRFRYTFTDSVISLCAQGNRNGNKDHIRCHEVGCQQNDGNEQGDDGYRNGKDCITGTDFLELADSQYNPVPVTRV